MDSYEAKEQENIKAIGGGVKIFFFKFKLNDVYLKEPPFVISKWAQPLLNSKLFFFHDISKLGPKRAKITKSQGIY